MGKDRIGMDLGNENANFDKIENLYLNQKMIWWATTLKC